MKRSKQQQQCICPIHQVLHVRPWDECLIPLWQRAPLCPKTIKNTSMCHTGWHVPSLQAAVAQEAEWPSTNQAGGSIPGPRSLHVEVLLGKILWHRCVMSSWHLTTSVCVSGWMLARVVKPFERLVRPEKSFINPVHSPWTHTRVVVYFYSIPTERNKTGHTCVWHVYKCV